MGRRSNIYRIFRRGGSDLGWAKIREAQRRAAAAIPDVHILTTTNLPLSDSLHNSAAANLVLGEKLAMQAARYLAGAQVPDFTPPEFESAALLSGEALAERRLEGIWLMLRFRHVSSWFVLYSQRGEESGFTLEDAEGEIPILTIRADVQDRNHVFLRLQRKPQKNSVLSFCWKADPVRFPLVDAVTYLPPVSFYQVPILDADGLKNE